MALVSAGFRLSVTLLDSEGSSSVLQYALTGAADFTAANNRATAILAALEPVTDAVIKGYSVGQVFAENALALPAGAEVERRAVITAKIQGSLPPKYANIVIPSPTQGIFQAATGSGARLIDKADAALQAYLAVFVTGAGLATVSDGEWIADPTVPENIEGRKMHRGSRRG
jgi:hypothetical protein